MSEVEDTIVLSSDEESPASKRIKTMLLGTMTGITITPILKDDKSKKKKLPDVCVISDEDEAESEDEENFSYETPEKYENSTSNMQTSVESSENQDCEIVSVNEPQKVINIIELEENTKNDKENGDTIEILDQIDEILQDSTNKLKSQNNVENEGGEVGKEIQNVEEKTNLVQNNDNILMNEGTIVNLGVSDQLCNETFLYSELSNSDLIEKFLEICKSKLKNTEYNFNSQFDMFKQYYNKCEPTLVEGEDFRKLIVNNIKKSILSASQAVISFGEVFMHLKDLVTVNTVEVTKKRKIKLKKMEHAIRQLVIKIKELENAEVDFSDEEDSSYLKLNRFISRLNKIYFKYCEYLKSNPYTGRITYSKLNFVDSQYNEINRAISKKYKDNKKFPSYIEMEHFIKKISEEHKLGITDAGIKSESEHCFRKLGELLQIRRKRELYDTHSLYIEDSGNDPASSDSNLKHKLEDNFNTAQKEIDRLCQEYVSKQDHGEDKEDSDKNTESSDNETDQIP